MGKKIALILGVATALMPAVMIIISHTHAWPEVFAERTDTFVPQGPTEIFNDITPSSRTDVITHIEGFDVRPVTASPVYLLMQPRMHTKTIEVVLVGKSATNVSTSTVHMGYRHGNGPQDNVLFAVPAHATPDGWQEWRVRMPLGDMTPERTDARRIVLEFPDQDSGNVWYIRSMRINYME